LPTSPTTNLLVHRYCTSISHCAIRSDEVLLISVATVCWCRDERASGSASNGGTGRTGTSSTVRSNAQGRIQFHLNHLVSARFHLVSISSPSCRHLVDISLPSRHHRYRLVTIVTISSPSRYHLITISSPSRHHLVTTSSPSRHHLVTISFPSRCHWPYTILYATSS